MKKTNVIINFMKILIFYLTYKIKNKQIIIFFVKKIKNNQKLKKPKKFNKYIALNKKQIKKQKLKKFKIKKYKKNY